mgnify:CR=1 FL=1
MTEIELNNEYFEWMCQLVCNERYSRRLSYQKLLRHLHNIDFQYMLPMDGNRAEDGIDLRYRFGYEKEYEGLMIASYLDNRPCSVLEMLIALAFRCEEHIMTDPDIGNRMGQWFWNMIVSLGLGSMSDSRFDAAYTDDVISRFMNRKYKRNGEGGLFTVERCKYAAATGSKGFRWLESEMVKQLDKQGDIDRGYYNNMVDEAIKSLSVYGDFERFAADEPYVSDNTPPWFGAGEPHEDDTTPFDVR